VAACNLAPCPAWPSVGRRPTIQSLLGIAAIGAAAVRLVRCCVLQTQPICYNTTTALSAYQGVLRRSCLLCLGCNDSPWCHLRLASGQVEVRALQLSCGSLPMLLPPFEAKGASMLEGLALSLRPAQNQIGGASARTATTLARVSPTTVTATLATDAADQKRRP
jgi:hypothetical protein